MCGGAFVLPHTPQLNCQSDDGAEALHVIYGIYVPMIFTMRVGGGLCSQHSSLISMIVTILKIRKKRSWKTGGLGLHGL